MPPLIPLPYARPEEFVGLWNRVAGKVHPVSPELWYEITLSDPSFVGDDLTLAAAPTQLGDRKGRQELAGFVLAKRLRRRFIGDAGFAEIGYVCLLAVDPAVGRQGLGRALLEAAEASLRQQGARRAILGGSFFHAVPGIPEALPEAIAFFERAGYSGGQTVWDVARDVKDFAVPRQALAALESGGIEAAVVRAERSMSQDPIRTAALLEFLAAEFAGRWLYDVSVSFGRGDTPATVLALFDGSRMVAFAQVHVTRSAGTLRWAAFDPDITAIGPVGVARTHRGKGLGLAVVALAADHLRLRGARTVVIDWTDLLGFYGQLGFEPWLSYRLMGKDL